MAEEVKIIIPDPTLQNFVNEQREKEKKALEVETPASVEGPPAVPKPTDEPSKPVAEVALKEPEKVEIPKEVTLSWDAGTETPKEEPSSKFDFSRLGSALELGEIKDETDFIGKISELKTKLKKSEESPLQGIPDDFKEVIEITKKTGDWKTYLAESIIDYSKVNPVKLYEEQAFTELSKLARFRNGDGSPKEQEIIDEIALIPETTRIVEGSRIQRSLIDQQLNRKNALVTQARERIIVKEKELSNSTKDLNQLLPFESYGIKFEPKHAHNIYEGVVTSKLTKKHLGVSYEDLVKSGADMKSVAKTIATAEYGEQMLKFKSSAATVAAKKEILEKVGNVQLTPPAVPAAPETKEKSVVQKYIEQMIAQRGKF